MAAIITFWVPLGLIYLWLLYDLHLWNKEDEKNDTNN